MPSPPRFRIPGSSWGIIGALYVLYAITAQSLPLVGELHYEFSALTALLASLVSGIGTLYRPSSRYSSITPAAERGTGTEANGGSSFRLDADDLLGILGRSVLLSLLPLLVALVVGLFGESCGIGEGIEWYLLLVPASAFLGPLLALLAESLARRRWKAIILLVLLWSLSLLRGAYEGYHGPHIFLYTWQVGFFPGGSWDTELPISGLLLFYRALHILAGTGLGIVLLLLGRYGGWRSSGIKQIPLVDRRTVRIVTMAALGVLAGLILYLGSRSNLGLTRTDAWLQAELGDSLTTRFATIYYNAPSSDSLDVWRAANLTDFHITEIAAVLKLPEDSIEHISVYLYRSPDEEKRLVGTSSAAFTKPWGRKLHMSFGSLEGSLRHELAHVMLAPFGNPLGISLSQGMIEGSAMALENEYGWRTLHEYAALLYAFKLAPPVGEIMSVGGFSSQRPSVAYLLSGSFSKWLIDTYGIESYLRAFPWGNFEEGFGKSLEQLSDEYSAFIRTYPRPDDSYISIKHLFGGGSFFAQQCLRRIGKLNGEGYRALSEERYDRALEQFKMSLGEGINYGARGGILRALAGLGRYRELLDSSAEYAKDTASYPLLPYLVEQGDAHWALGDTASAKRLYDSVIALDISRSLRLRASLRRYFIGANDSLARIMQSYFTRQMSRTQRLVVLSEASAVVGDSMDFPILKLMQASLISSELPITSLRTVDQLRSYVDVNAYNSILPPLLENFRDAAYYTERVDPQRDVERISWILWGPYSPEGSLNYDRERRSEAKRFREYLKTHTIFP